jgi:hypothetical protein
MNPDHYPRLCAQRQQAAENAAMDAAEKRLEPLFWLVFAAAAVMLIWLPSYNAGKAAAQRECLPTQQGERLLSTEQHGDITLCNYAAGSASYGRSIKQRKARS